MKATRQVYPHMRFRRFVITSLVALTFSHAAFAQDEGDEIAPVPEAPGEAPPAESAPPADDAGKVIAAEGDEEDPARPPPKGKGVVWGVVTDDQGEPMIEATVSVVGTKIQTITDLEGRYRLELAPGTHSIRIFYELYRPQRVDGVRVAAGGVNRLDVKLAADEEAIDVMEIETEADRAALEGQMLTRQRTAATSDSIGRAEISKAPDSNAAEAAQRVVGANIVGGRFVYVRGLGERYTNSLLNGAPLPSPEPDRAAVPLDLFPALVLESVSIVKTFTPDMPGDFAGGSVRIDTREIPGKFLFNAGMSLGYNTQSTFREQLGYLGSSTDFLGFDNGTRSMPDEVPEDHLAFSGRPKPDGSLVTDEEADRIGRAMNAFMSTRRELVPPNHSFNVVAADGWKIGPEQRLGVLAAITYSRSFQIRDEIRREYEPIETAPNGLGIWNDLEVETGNDAVRWGAYGSLSYQLAKGHRLTLTGLRSQMSDDKAQIFEGFSKNIQADFHDARLSFVSRVLNVGQLRGEHDFPELDDAELVWNASISGARRDEPDTRDVVYTTNEEGAFFYPQTTETGRHFFSDQTEQQLGGGIDFTQPLVKGPHETKLKLGGLVSLRERQFLARRFSYGRMRPPLDGTVFSCGTEVTSECIDDLFVNDNIGTNFRLQEDTQKTDSYNAGLNIYAAYLMGEIGVLPALRVVVGQRLEITRQTVETFDPLKLCDESCEGADLGSTDLLPALGIIYSVTKQAKLRASVTRTIARPQLRELAPFQFSDYFGGQQIFGNPDLKLTHITNGDLRFEYFPTLKEVLALSVFVKDFQDPIEPVVSPSSTAQLVTFENSPGAILRGIELEARKALGFLSDTLDDFTFIGNLTLAHSQIDIEQTDRGFAGGFITNLSRPMVHQAPYVINLALDYESDFGFGARVLYNVSGPRVVAVGTAGLDDAYEHPRHLVDLSVSQGLGKHFQIKATAENVLNSEVLVTQGSEARDDNITRQYTDGVTFGIGASYTN